MNESPTRIAELLQLYRRTHYRVALADGTLAALRIGATPPPDIADWIGADGFAVYLTACNPHSRLLSDEDNRQRLSELDERLRDAGARLLAGSASIPDETWAEPSRLVAGIGLDRLDALARAFEQNASVRARVGHPVRLRLHRPDWWANLPDDGDWERDGSPLR